MNMFEVIYPQLPLVMKKKTVQFFFFYLLPSHLCSHRFFFRAASVLPSHLSTLAAAQMDSAAEPDADEMQAETERSGEEAAIPIGFGGRDRVSPVLRIRLGRALPGGAALA
jgi:hypothetical protein